jgi:hypothetical protein
MVAPAYRTRRPAPSPAMRRAHQVVAKTLLRKRAASPPPVEKASPVTPWKAWLLTLWIAVLAAAGAALVVRWG